MLNLYIRILKVPTKTDVFMEILKMVLKNNMTYQIMMKEEEIRNKGTVN